ncbi:hypothetical protein C8R46DRAFT_242344 [Mycena filopes]|nr:hypothetical protein C8R46DRAFT_242344 [Mycena filopes]
MLDSEQRTYRSRICIHQCVGKESVGRPAGPLWDSDPLSLRVCAPRPRHPCGRGPRRQRRPRAPARLADVQSCENNISLSSQDISLAGVDWIGARPHPRPCERARRRSRVQPRRRPSPAASRLDHIDGGRCLQYLRACAGEKKLFTAVRPRRVDRNGSPTPPSSSSRAPDPTSSAPPTPNRRVIDGDHLPFARLATACTERMRKCDLWLAGGRGEELAWI